MVHFRPEVISFFRPFLNLAAEDKLIIPYSTRVNEIWSPEIHLLPSTTEIWLAGELSQLASDLYISYSAAELISFVSRQPGMLNNIREQQAFAALGLLPDRSQVDQLKARYPQTHWHLLFGSDLIGKITDARVASWYKAHPAKFRLEEQWLVASFRGRTFYFNPDFFSLHQFEKVTGLRSGIRTHKPRQGRSSFIHTLMNTDES